jgi:serine/threonine protein phosphatase PrpC
VALQEERARGGPAATDLSAALAQAMQRTEEEFLEFARQKQIYSGSTGCVLLVSQAGELVVGSVGDTEAHLARSGRPVALTRPHNPKRNEEERRRVLDMGGRIWQGRLGHPRLNPAYFSLAVSRAFGDLYFKDPEHTANRVSGLVATPDISRLLISPEDDFVRTLPLPLRPACLPSSSGLLLLFLLAYLVSLRSPSPPPRSPASQCWPAMGCGTF